MTTTVETLIEALTAMLHTTAQEVDRQAETIQTLTKERTTANAECDRLRKGYESENKDANHWNRQYCEMMRLRDEAEQRGKEFVTKLCAAEVEVVRLRKERDETRGHLIAEHEKAERGDQYRAWWLMADTARKEAEAQRDEARADLRRAREERDLARASAVDARREVQIAREQVVREQARRGGG